MNYWIFTIVFSFFSCVNKQEGGREVKINRTTFICIQPLDNIGRDYINYLSEALPRWFHAKVLVFPNEPMPSSSWYPIRKRYVADSLLLFLKTKSNDSNTFVLGVTAKDISTMKGTNPSWGIMGLGFQPGNACVISLFRIQKNSAGNSQLEQRLLKLAIHELGHNFGLPHCKNRSCMMADSEGKDCLNREKDLCKKCRAYLSQKGYL